MARRWKRLVGITVLIIFALLIVGITTTIGWRPFIGPKTRALTDRRFEATPARFERGSYLVNGVLGCLGCHSEPDASLPGVPPRVGRLGAGAAFDAGPDFPGRLIAPNITPDSETGAGSWSDDVLARAIREGIGHDGRALFPIMPYTNYHEMPDEDLASVIVYLRSLAPVRNELPKTEIRFPVKYLIRGAPQPVTGAVPTPDLSDSVKRGEFLVRMASCADCHTPQDRGQRKPGFEFAGGLILNGPRGPVMAVNVTPDASGISYYDEELFLQVIRTGHVKATELSPAMPWVIYRNMNDQDLKAIFAYLQTLKPVKHTIDNSEALTLCRLCGLKHGGGERN